VRTEKSISVAIRAALWYTEALACPYRFLSALSAAIDPYRPYRHYRHLSAISARSAPIGPIGRYRPLSALSALSAPIRYISPIGPYQLYRPYRPCRAAYTHSHPIPSFPIRPAPFPLCKSRFPTLYYISPLTLLCRTCRTSGLRQASFSAPWQEQR